MKVSFTSNENVSSKTSTLSSCGSNISIQAPAFPAAAAAAAGVISYEPKSVLELRRSPSPNVPENAHNPPLDAAEISAGCDDPLQLADHVLTNFEDWDSLMKDLGLKEDTTKPNSESLPTQFPEFPLAHSLDSAQFLPSDHFSFSDNVTAAQYPPPAALSSGGNITASNDFQNHNWNLGFDYVDELIRFAECFETNAVQLAHVILARLNHKLRSATGKPLQRAAFYFKESLQSLLTWSTRMTRPNSSSEIVHTIKAYKIFSNISPIPMFSSFTANQAVLEAVDGSMLVHVIDFDIGLGGHWASFMKELADKAESARAKPALRITALVPDEYAVESRLIRENLTQFARDLNMAFDIDFVLIHTFELLSFKAIKFMEGEKIAVILSPSIFRRVGAGFVNDLRRISPHVVVHVDNEGLVGFGPSSFRQTVIDGLEFYSTLLESLEAANIGGGSGGGGDWMRKIETYVLYPKIMEMVGAAGRRGASWREAFIAAGFRPVVLSQFADFQADCLLGRVQVRGFHVAKRQAEMLLCWHDRALVATSAWR
ncbi:PREDICTED: scarecrow-like protein 15 [Ipomoea nil]|uniref:scarecrow-like protein 15 n=1 Tax=Ipomoea nil TaxID=35883 RepID=UPI0009008FB4|nr:PREDICTED: scarecrow-like protein 15 [Ipomoea nil]